MSYLVKFKVFSEHEDVGFFKLFLFFPLSLLFVCRMKCVKKIKIHNQVGMKKIL